MMRGEIRAAVSRRWLIIQSRSICLNRTGWARETFSVQQRVTEGFGDTRLYMTIAVVPRHLSVHGEPGGQRSEAMWLARVGCCGSSGPATSHSRALLSVGPSVAGGLNGYYYYFRPIRAYNPSPSKFFFFSHGQCQTSTSPPRARGSLGRAPWIC